MRKQALLVAALAAAAVKGIAAQGSPGGYPGVDPNLKWVQMHGWLMASSFGFFFPMSLLLIRFGRPKRDSTSRLTHSRVMLLFYLHVLFAVLGVLGATTGVAILLHRDGGSFDYTHQRLGLALMIIMWMQPFIGLVRPARGVTARPFWFALHWVFGTGAVVLGMINCYIGINAYQFLFRHNIRSLNIAFSCLLAFLALAYFLQDKYDYIANQKFSDRPSAITDEKTFVNNL